MLKEFTYITRICSTASGSGKAFSFSECAY